MKNPAAFVKHLALDEKSKYIPSEWDLLNLKGGLDREQALLVAFCLETGCRINEALGLTVDDIGEETIKLTTRKAKNSNRTTRVIPKPHCLIDVELPESGRVFARWTKQPRFLEKIVKKLFPEGQRFGWHNFRHKAASEWAASGMPVVEIMARLGHSNIETTQKYLQSLGFTATPYTGQERPEFLRYEDKDLKQELAEIEFEEDVKLFELLKKKMGEEKAREIVFG